jgi:hypothetical protein
MRVRKGEAPRTGTVQTGKGSRGAIVQRAVWAALIVVIPPKNQFLPGFVERAEPFDVQAFVPQTAVKPSCSGGSPQRMKEEQQQIDKRLNRNQTANGR